MNKRAFGLILAAGLVPSLAFANLSDDFQANVQSNLLKPFALDVGGLVGSFDFHSARALSFPGFDAGVAAAVQSKPGHDNAILQNAGVGAIGLPVLQVSAGLPVVPLNLSVRGFSLQGINMVGGGLRYGLYKSGLLLAIPDISVNANYDVLSDGSHDDFKLNHLSGGVEASFNLPLLKPFIGVGFDSTKITVNNASDASLIGLSATAQGMRYQVGATFSPLPFVYLYGAYNSLHGETGYDFGLGARFGGVL